MVDCTAISGSYPFGRKSVTYLFLSISLFGVNLFSYLFLSFLIFRYFSHFSPLCNCINTNVLQCMVKERDNNSIHNCFCGICPLLIKRNVHFINFDEKK